MSKGRTREGRDSFSGSGVANRQGLRSERFHWLDDWNSVSTSNSPSGADRTVEARQVLLDNDRGGYTVPTAKLYPFQWNWDSVFVALGWAEFDLDRAWKEITTLFEAQWPSGMVPHIIFWTDQSSYFPGPDVWGTINEPQSSGISQPPVAATVLRTLEEIEPRLTVDLFTAIDQWHQWWHAARDPQDIGLIAIAHPWESGRDNLPDWDEPMSKVDSSNVGTYQRRDLDMVDQEMRPHQHEYDRYLALVEFGAAANWDDDVIGATNPFLVADPGVTSILLRAERDLAWLGRSIGSDTEHIERRIDRLEDGFDRLWNPKAGTYCSLDLRSGRHADAGTSASFLALYAGVTTHLDQLADELERWASACNFLVPSFDPRHQDFEPKRYWRGPVWAMINYMIAVGFAEAGAEVWADRIRQSTHDLMVKTGMPESFDPMTGGPVGGSHFAWTAALWLSWAGKA